MSYKIVNNKQYSKLLKLKDWDWNNKNIIQKQNVPWIHG